MNKSSILVLVVLLVILCLCTLVTYVLYVVPNDSTNSDAHKNLSATADHTFIDLDGNAIDFKQYEGKVRVVTLWASWNPFSAAELQNFEAVAQQYLNQEIVIIALNRNESKEQAQRFLNTLSKFSHLVFAIDQNDSFYTSVGGYAMPETLFYDSVGNITFHKRGTLSVDELKQHIDDAIKAQE